MDYNTFLKKYVMNRDFKPKQINDIRKIKKGFENIKFNYDGSYAFPEILNDKATQKEKENYVKYYSLLYGLGV